MFVNIEGQEINCETAGFEKPVLFLHGWGGSMASFRGCFNVLKRDFKVFNLELPGFGQSAPPAAPFGTEDYARIVSGFIKNVCGGPVCLIGHSFGGRVALILAAEHPEWIEKMILIDSAGMRPRRGLRYFFRVCRYKIVKLSVKLRLLNERKLKSCGSPDWRALSPAMRAAFIKVINRHLEETAARVHVPTLILWGGRDKDTPPYMAKRLNKLIAGSRLYIFPRAGHYSYIDCFWESTELIKEFFRPS